MPNNRSPEFPDTPDATASGIIPYLGSPPSLLVNASTDANSLLPSVLDIGGTERYEMLEEIARGGMGMVWRARDRFFVREVGLKTLLKVPQEGSVTAARFRAEAHITGQLQHPNIPPVHDLGTLPDGRPFLAMKLIKGRTLEAILKERPDPSHDRGRFIAIFEQIAHGVAYAHAHHVIHRDLKPLNVMVGAFGEVQVMDWGLAKVLTSQLSSTASESAAVQVHPLTTSEVETAAETEIRPVGTDEDGTRFGSVMGTPAYMPREQAIGAVDQIDTRSDVFSLGGILCAILTGQPPYISGNAETTRQLAAAAKLDDTHVRLDACGAEPDLIALAKRCLSAERDERPKDAGAVASEVAALRAEAEKRARQAETEAAEALVREAEGGRRRWWQRIAAGVFVLLVAGGAGVAWWRDSEAGKRRAEILQMEIEDEKRAQADRDRVTKNSGALSSWVDQCETALKSEQAEVAETALVEIDRRLPGGGADDHLPRIGRCRADIAMLKELDRIDNNRWTHVVNGQLPSLEHNAVAWAAAFRQFGIVPGQTPPAEVARRIKDSLIGDRLLAALDMWLLEGPSVEVFRLIREIDPDPYRNSIRNTIWLKAPELLGVQSVIGPPFEQPARFALVLGSYPTVPPWRREEILRSAHHKHPTNLAIMMTAAAIYPLNQKEGAAKRVGWYRAALAVRPTSTAVWNNLGVSLSDAGDLDGAIEAYQEIIRLDPKFAPAYHNRASVMKARGDPEAAIEEYRKAIAADPTFARAHNDLGVMLKEKNDLAGAAACYREAVRLNPMDGVAHFNLGAILKALGDVDGSIPCFREAIRYHPRLALAHHELGNALRLKGDLDGAIASYQQAIRLDPKFPDSHYHLGLTLRDKRDLDGAIARYNEAIRLDPKLALSRYALGIALREKGNPEGALAAFREAIRLDPKYALAHAAVGVSLSERNDHDGAIRHLSEAVKLDPKDNSARLNLGLALSYKADWDGAIACLKEVVRVDPKHASAHAALGTALSEKNELDAAIASYKEAIRLDPTLALAHHNLGNALRVKGNLDGAIASYREAARHAPDDATSHEKLGKALCDRGDFAGAVVAYRELVRIVPTSPSAHNLLGVAFAGKGDTDAAIAAYQKAIELDPGYAPAHYNLGNALKNKGKLDEVIAAYQKAIELDPKFAMAHVNLGVCYLDQKKYTEAIACTRLAIQADPKLSNAHALLGHALQQIGDLTGARAALAEAARLDPRWKSMLARVPPPPAAPPPREAEQPSP